MEEKLNEIIFYQLEAAIKSYRQFAQRNIQTAGYDITIDQWLVLKKLKEDPSITQQQLASQVFKDFASITRIVELLVRKKYLQRNNHPVDRRRFVLTIQPKGLDVLSSVQNVINKNRKKALKDVSEKEIKNLQSVLQRIVMNTAQDQAAAE
ncbi:MAG: MarR family transcriptional regulator [Chitinophagaceae bacterium]